MSGLQTIAEKVRELRADLSELIDSGAVDPAEAAALADELLSVLSDVAREAGLDVDAIPAEAVDDGPE